MKTMKSKYIGANRSKSEQIGANRSEIWANRVKQTQIEGFSHRNVWYQCKSMKTVRNETRDVSKRCAADISGIWNMLSCVVKSVSLVTASGIWRRDALLHFHQEVHAQAHDGRRPRTYNGHMRGHMHAHDLTMHMMYISKQASKQVSK